MKNNKSLFIGLPVLVIAGIGIALLFIHPPAAAEEEETEIETVVPVHAGKILQTTLHGYETVYGHVEAAPSPPARVAVRASIDGVLLSVSCQPGQAVAAGDELFQLDARTAGQAMATQQQSLEFARQEFTRQEQLLKIEGTSQRDYQQAARDFHQAEQAFESAGIQLDYHTVRAPIDGTVVSLAAAAGAPVQPGLALAEILDARRLVVAVQVPAAAASRIKIEQPIELLTGEQWRPAGTIDYISPAIDPRNGTVEVRAALAADGALRAGQFIKARIGCETHADCLAVPAAAVVDVEDGGSVVAVIHGDMAEQHPVQRKLREGDLIEIEGEGLAAGMAIVTEGAYGLPEKTRIEVVGE